MRRVCFLIAVLLCTSVLALPRPVRPHGVNVPGVDVTPNPQANPNMGIQDGPDTITPFRTCTAVESKACGEACEAISQELWSCNIATDTTCGKLTMTCRCHVPISRLVARMKETDRARLD